MTTCLDEGTDMRRACDTDICSDMCTDMCVDVCRHVYRHVYKHLYFRGTKHVVAPSTLEISHPGASKRVRGTCTHVLHPAAAVGHCRSQAHGGVVLMLRRDIMCANMCADMCADLCADMRWAGATAPFESPRPRRSFGVPARLYPRNRLFFSAMADIEPGPITGARRRRAHELCSNAAVLGDPSRSFMPYIIMAFIVVAFIVMAYVVMAL